MEFTELAELQSFVSTLMIINSIPTQRNVLANTSQTPKDLPKIMDEISQINHSRSLVLSALEHEYHNQQAHLIKADDLHQQKETFEVDSDPKQNFLHLPGRKSNIFTQSRKGSRTIESTNMQFSDQNWEIRVYFFGQHIYKDVSYSKNTSVLQLIKKSINLAILENIFDHGILKTTNPYDYEMRFTQSEQSFHPDMKVQPIDYSRILSQTLLEFLVLMPKPKQKAISLGKNLFVQKKQDPTIETFDFSNEGLIKLNLFNEDNNEIGSIILPKEQTLEKVFQYLASQLISNFRLSESLTDQFSLPQDFQLKNLNTYRLYVKKKRFLDQPQNLNQKPFKVINSIPKDLSHKMPPIGMTEASVYEEFNVIKINSRGSRQMRILGIDQTKIYNYDPQLRSSKKETGIFSKILGHSAITGTKKPYRLIEDIINIEDHGNLLFQVQFKEKKIMYLVNNMQTKEKILRKLRFLATTKNKK